MVREALKNIEHGMTVFDLNNNEIGEVTMLMYGDETIEETGPQTATSKKAPLKRTPGWVDEFIEVMSIDKPIPEPLQERLHREGFIRVREESYLGDKDYFVTMNEITNVTDNRVIINTPKSKLMPF